MVALFCRYGTLESGVKYLAILLVLSLSGCGFIHMTPAQERLFSKEQPAKYINAEELRELLPRYAVVEDGTYQLTPRGMMPTDVWCNPYVSDIVHPKDWNCQDYSRAAAEQMEGYVFGLAWNDDHMVNVFVDTDFNILLYDYQVCQFVRMPVNGIAIKGEMKK